MTFPVSRRRTAFPREFLRESSAGIPDGRIVVAGSTGAIEDLAVIRFNSDGSLDTAAALQANGRILVAGVSDNAGDDDFAIVRYR